MRARLQCILLALLLAPPGLAAQVDYASSPEGLMQRFDTNGDGVIHETEYVAYLGRGFTVRDVDRDGVLRGDEIAAGTAALTRVEHEARLRRQFRRQDRNRDSALSANELMAPPPG